MGYARIELDKNLITLISRFNVRMRVDGSVGVDGVNLFGGTHAREDMARILGWYDLHIPGTEEDADGVNFPEEVNMKLDGYYDYLTENLEYIQSLVQQYAFRGGITPGKYKARADALMWERIEELS